MPAGVITPVGAFLFLTVSPRHGGLKYIMLRVIPAERMSVMIKMLVTKASISKGYNDAPALKFSENAENPSVRFRIGVMVYDKRAEKEHRFVNINVKAFGYLVDRIRNMKLEAGSYVNIIGRYDEDIWEDQTTREKKSAPVLIVDEIEYGTNNANGGGKQTGTAGGAAAPGGQEPAANPPADSGQEQGSFTGYAAFGGPNPYFPES